MIENDKQKIVEQMVEYANDQLPNDVHHRLAELEELLDGDFHIKIPLPQANSHWTFDSFRIAWLLVNNYDHWRDGPVKVDGHRISCYPVHNSECQYSYLYIKVSISRK